MSAVRPALLLTLVLSVVAGGTSGITLLTLHDAALGERRRALQEAAAARSRLLAAPERVRDALTPGEPGAEAGATARTLHASAGAPAGLGETGRLLVGFPEGDAVRMVVAGAGGEGGDEVVVALGSDGGDAMARALRGESGTLSGRDHRGVPVLAAYAPVAGLRAGVVATVERAEIRAPFLAGGALAAALTLLLAGVGSAVLRRWCRGMDSEIVRLQDLRRVADERLRLAVEGGGLGFWEADFQAGTWHPSEQLRERLGYAPGELEPTIEQWTELLHPDDAEASIRNADELASGVPHRYDSRFRLRTADGGWAWIHSMGSMVDPERGRAAGVHRDVTAQHELLETVQRNERRLAGIVAALPGSFVAILDRELHYRYAAGEGLELLGLDPETMLGTQVGDTLPEATAARLRGHHRTILDGGTVDFDLQFQDRTVLVRATPLHGPGGEVEGILALATDITGQKERERLLHEQRERLDRIIENIPRAGVAVLDRELGVQHLGGEEVARMGPDAARLQAGPFLSWVEPTHRDRLEALVGDALDGRQARSRGVVSGLLAGGGAPKALEISAGPLRGRDGEVQGILVLWVDVSEEWEARQALEATRQRLELSLDAGQHGTYDVDLVTGRGEVSDLYARMLGYDPEDFEESVESWSARLHPEDRERALAAAQGIIHGEANHYHVEFRQRTASGAWLWIRSVARPLERDADGRPTRLIGTHTDINREKETERTRDLLSTAVEQSSSLVLITDPDGVIEYVNPAFEQVTGYAAGESVGRDAAFLRSEGHPEALPPEAWERVRAGESVELEVVNRRKDGIDYRQHTVASPIVTDDGRVRSVVVIGRDVTSERILEDQLRQAQKMEAVGQLTGGIAHDFNNVLTGILSNIRLALDEVPEEADGLRQEIEEVRKAARHGAGLVRKLMAFSRDTYLDRVPVRVAEVVEEVGRFLSRLLPATIDLELDSLAPAAVVSLDPSAVQQILLNLASNARDAMPSGGALRITSRVDETEDRWVLEVEDQGVGMAPDVVERIFEPFFTTKSQGTGLGLAMVYALTERQEGRLSVSSTPGRGTLFRLSFPLSDEEPVSREEPSPPAEAGPGHGRVLVVEDEPAVRRAAQRILERSGYQVQVAEDGVRGLEVLQRDTDGIDLVVTDMVMPGMGGVELWRAAGRGRPGTPLFLFTSGYAEHDLTEELGEAAGSRFLRKPWDGGELLAVVHQSLEEARG